MVPLTTSCFDSLISFVSLIATFFVATFCFSHLLELAARDARRWVDILLKVVEDMEDERRNV